MDSDRLIERIDFAWHTGGAEEAAEAAWYGGYGYTKRETIENAHSLIDEWDVPEHVREGVRSYLPPRRS